MPLSFTSQRLWCLNLNSYLDSEQLTQIVTKAPVCPFIWYCRAASHSSMLANTTWWKRLLSKGFQHSDTKTVAVGNELQLNTMLHLLNILLCNAELLLNIVRLNYSKKNVNFAHFDFKIYLLGQYRIENRT
jgi:hypothetical protein